MCEFKVFIEAEQIAGDVIYARQEKNKVILKDVMGNPQTINGVEIIEVDVLSTKLTLGRRPSG